jgi:hypothetical protein
MKPLIAKVRPVSGFSWFLHILLLSLLPIILFVLVRMDFATLAVLIVILSKWRMFAVKPRFWPANIRANSVDIIAGLSILVFMVETNSQAWQLGWTALYIIWLTVIKPSSQTFMIGVQALVSFLWGLGALFLIGDEASALYLVAGTGAICYLVAHHFFDAFEEAYSRLLAYLWAFFGAGLVWVLSHWLLYYPSTGVVSQAMLILVTIGYGLAAIYYLDHTERLSKTVRNQFVFIMIAITAIILIFSDWGDKII